MPARHAPGIGLGVGLIGLVLVVLTLLVLPWSDADDSRFTDLSSAVRDAGSDAIDDTALYVYVAWAAYVLLALVVVALVMACVPIPPSAAGNSWMRVVGGVLAGTAAILHTVTVTHLYRGPAAPEVPAYLAVGGYVMIGIAMVIGARRAPVRALPR